jgi:hypothetical protein
MGSESGRGVVPGPSTYIGQWLRAALLDQRGLRNRLLPTLNNGKPGWNNDEPAVLEAAFELAMRQYFGEDYDVRAITEFVTRMRAGIHSTQPPRQLEMEALIRSALGEADVATSDINSGKKYTMRLTALGQAKIQLGWDEAAVDKVLVEAEDIASARGWNPPRSPPGT